MRPTSTPGIAMWRWPLRLTLSIRTFPFTRILALSAPLASGSGPDTPAALDQRVRTIAGMLEIDMLLGRMPTQLSCAKAARVALGRALVREPAVFLLDEPIAHLDATLRNRMHAELRRIQKQLGTTTIYATPDYVEGMAMADRLAVVHQGRTVQVLLPLEIYYNLTNEFVARFVGDPPMKVFETALVSDQDGLAIKLAGQALRLSGRRAAAVSQFESRHVRVGVRPGDIALPHGEEPAGSNTIPAEVRVVEPSERTLVVSLRADGVDFKLKGPRTAPSAGVIDLTCGSIAANSISSIPRPTSALGSAVQGLKHLE